MGNSLKYLLILIACFGCTVSLSAGEDTPEATEPITLQDKLIEAFRNSMGFDYLTKDEVSATEMDSIMKYLETSKQYDILFELERILVKSCLLDRKSVV